MKLRLWSAYVIGGIGIVAAAVGFYNLYIGTSLDRIEDNLNKLEKIANCFVE